MIKVAPRCRSLVVDSGSSRRSVRTYRSINTILITKPSDLHNVCNLRDSAIKPTTASSVHQTHSTNSSHEESLQLQPFEIACISIVSSFAATVFTAPLNALKLLAIDQNSNNISKVIASTNIKSLYRGYWSAVLKFAPRHALEHTLFNSLKNILSPGVAGCISTMASVIVAHPLDSLHIRNVLCHDIRCMRALFKGALPAVAQAAMSGVLWYNTLNFAKQFTTNGFVQCGASSFVTNITLHPLDVLKTTCSTKNMNALVALRHLQAERNIFAGIGVVAITSIPCQTLAYGTYITMRDAYISHKKHLI